jgi:hypothetical protein
MSIFVECHHDYAAMRALSIPRRLLVHEHCKGNVVNRMRTATTAARGLVDEDPGSENHPADLPRYAIREEAFDLRLRVNTSDARKVLIEVCPMLEAWLLKRARVCGIDPARHGIPSSVRDLRRPARFDRIPGFHRFLADLAATDDGMRTLKKWLTG